MSRDGFFQYRCDVCHKSPTNGRHLFSLEHPHHQGCISSALWATFRRKVRPGYSVDIIARYALICILFPFRNKS